MRLRPVAWGGALSQRITLTNDSRLGVPALRITDQSTLPDHPHGYVTSLKAKHSITWEVEIPCHKRGRYRVGPVEAHMSDPLGLFPVRRQLGDAGSILVLPRWVTLKRCALKLDGFLPGEARGRRRGESPPSVVSVREYAIGDSVASIHWPATARMGQLMTKFFDPEVQTTLWLALDLDGELPFDVEELLVTATTSLTMYALHEANLRVGLVASGMVPVMLPSERGKPHQYRLQEVLAEVHGGSVSLLDGQLAQLDRHLGPGQAIALVTSRSPDTWSAWLGRLVGRGVAARVVEIRQPAPGSPDGAGGDVIGRSSREAHRWAVPSIVLPVALADVAQEQYLINLLEGRSPTTA